MDGLERWRILRLHVEDQVPLAALARESSIGTRTLQRWHQLTRPRPSIATLHRLTVEECLRESRPAPSYATVRQIVQALDPALVTLALEGPASYRDRHELVFIQSTTPVHRYSIPAPGGGWMDTTPEAHLDYVDAANTNPGGAKDLARLVKAWKYHQQVPISSFYLEMRAAQHMATQTNFIPVWDLCLLLEKLDEWSLRPMQDPTGNTGSIRATSSTGAAIEAQSKLATAATRARKALNAYNAGNPDEAFRYLDLLFGGTFPSR